MTAPVRVVSANDFLTWVKQQQASSPVTTTSTTTGTSTTSTPASTLTTVTTSPPVTTTGQAVTINLTAQNIAFDKNSITVPAGAAVTVNFNNKDTGTPHNFSVYTNSSAATVIFTGQIVTGPTTTVYTFTAPSTPGTYFFRCDVHPTIMTGSFIVQ